MTRFMKIIIFTSTASAVMFSSMAMAVDLPNNVYRSKHNFSLPGGESAQYLAIVDGTLGNQICIYCHTPHNAGQNNLLWNKAGNGNTTFRLYTSSETLSHTAKAATLSADSPSLLCMSCHDGKTAMNVLHTRGEGPPASDPSVSPALSGYPDGSRLAYGTTPLFMVNPLYFFGAPALSPNLGGVSGDDLTNDHPIGFSYTDAFGEKGSASLKAIGSIDPRIKFRGTTNKVECTSCHNPHVDSNDTARIPFLVMSNSASALCLACHNK